MKNFPRGNRDRGNNLTSRTGRKPTKKKTSERRNNFNRRERTARCSVRALQFDHFTAATLNVDVRHAVAVFFQSHNRLGVGLRSEERRVGTEWESTRPP